MCLEDSSSQLNGNKICSTNYDSLQDAESDCFKYKCDVIIEYEFDDSGKIVFRS